MAALDAIADMARRYKVARFIVLTISEREFVIPIHLNQNGPAMPRAIRSKPDAAIKASTILRGKYVSLLIRGRTLAPVIRL